ncbi:MAG TPA: RNA polymerase sigma factor [Candidatus Kapabacteria bacterium]|nr:RNA polymerase sigma factor [Candidatus Kapabacteria bacterium]
MDAERKQRFLELLEPVYPRLSRYALAMTRNREEAKDLVSEAVLVALERFDTIRDEAGFPGFLYRIVARTYKHWHRRDRRFTAIDKIKLEAILDLRAMPDVAAEIALVRAALDRLPIKMKEAILLFDVADLSLEEIRKIQGGTLSGVKSRLRRGREILRATLGIDAEPTPGRKTDGNKSNRTDQSHIIRMEAIETYAL